MSNNVDIFTQENIIPCLFTSHRGSRDRKLETEARAGATTDATEQFF